MSEDRLAQLTAGMLHELLVRFSHGGFSSFRFGQSFGLAPEKLPYYTLIFNYTILPMAVNRTHRYVQYFCNVPDEGLQTFVSPSTLSTFRKRVGTQGMDLVEQKSFERLHRAGVIQNDTQLIDSTVMEDNILYPTDVLLLYRAFSKMRQFVENQHKAQEGFRKSQQ